MNYTQAMQGLTTCDLSDACDALSIQAVSDGAIRAMHAGCRPICGPIATCHMSPRGKTEIVIGTIGPLLEAAPGSIFLVSSEANMALNTIGSLVAVVAVQSRLAGAVVDGCVRDVQGMQELDFSTYARGTVVPSVRGRMAIESVNQPVPFAGGRVEPGWIAAADANGVIVFPPERAREVFEFAWRAVALEKKIFQQIQHGGDAIALHKAMKYDLSMRDQLSDRGLL
jgi:4-hydroxy-4-methyl-2-oxoglutarate aldolase